MARPNIRVQASGFRCTETVSGDRVHTASTVWYRNGQPVFVAQRYVLRVDNRPELSFGKVQLPKPRPANYIEELSS